MAGFGTNAAGAGNMADDARSDAQSIASAARSGVNAAKRTVNSAVKDTKAVKKAAGQIASGNYLGAAKTALENPMTVIKIVLVALFILSIPLMIVMFCAVFVLELPGSIEESVQAAVTESVDSITLGWEEFKAELSNGIDDFFSILTTGKPSDYSQAYRDDVAAAQDVNFYGYTGTSNTMVAVLNKYFRKAYTDYNDQALEKANKEVEKLKQKALDDGISEEHIYTSVDPEMYEERNYMNWTFYIMAGESYSSRNKEGLHFHVKDMVAAAKDLEKSKIWKVKTKSSYKTEEVVNTWTEEKEVKYSAGSLLTKKIHTIKSFMHLVVKDLTQEEEQLIDTCLITVYKKFGITNDNNSIYDRETGQYKKMPLLQDLHKEMLKYQELHRISNILNPLITGSMACYNRPTNVDLKAKYIVFDFNGMKGAILTMSMFVVLDFVWTKIKEDRKKRKAVFIDECWKLIGTDSNEMAAEDVVEIFRTIRAYGGSAFAMTQDISQFYEYKGGKYGKAIIGNADTKIIMHLIPSEAQALQAAIQLTDAEMENVSSLQRGQGLVCSSSAKLFVDFVAADYEKQEITTDAKSFYMQEKALKEKQHQEEQARLEAEDKEKPAKTDDNNKEH